MISVQLNRTERRKSLCLPTVLVSNLPWGDFMRYPKVTKYGSMDYDTQQANAAEAKAQSEKKKAEEMAEKNAERKLNYRFEIIKTFITIGATLLVEHFTEIFNFLCDLLHRLFS